MHVFVNDGTHEGGAIVSNAYKTPCFPPPIRRVVAGMSVGPELPRSRSFISRPSGPDSLQFAGLNQPVSARPRTGSSRISASLTSKSTPSAVWFAVQVSGPLHTLGEPTPLHAQPPGFEHSAQALPFLGMVQPCLMMCALLPVKKYTMPVSSTTGPRPACQIPPPGPRNVQSVFR